MHEVNVYAREGKHGRTHWQYDFRVELPDGTIHRERRKARGANTEAAARRIGEARMLQVIREGQLSAKKGPRAVPTLAEFAAEWLELGRSERQSPCTLRNRTLMLDKHILPELGDRRLDGVDEKALQSLRRRLTEHKSSTVNLIVRTLMAMLRCAERLGHKVRLPKVKPLAEVRERHWYTPSQYEALVASAATFGPEHLVTILLGGDAGLRSGEITALRWSDVDLEMETLYVRRNFAGGEERAPKCSKTREVPLSHRLRAALLGLRRVMETRGHVLLRDDGQPCRNYYLARRIAQVADYAGVPVYGPHALRHAFASRLMLSGSGARVVMDLLGHSSLQVTQIYTHATADHRRDAIRRLSTDMKTPGET